MFLCVSVFVHGRVCGFSQREKAKEEGELKVTVGVDKPRNLIESYTEFVVCFLFTEANPTFLNYSACFVRSIYP